MDSTLKRYAEYLSLFRYPELFYYGKTPSRRKPAQLSKGEKKKCKSCKFYIRHSNGVCACTWKRLPTHPFCIACNIYEPKRKNKPEALNFGFPLTRLSTLEEEYQPYNNELECLS